MSVLKEHLLEKYADLVWKVVKSYKVKTKADNEDAFQAGCLGLCEAHNRFDASKGHQFSTYAFPWINKYVREFSRSNSFYVDIPPHQMQIAQKVYRAFVEFRSERMLRVEAIRKTASKLGMSFPEVQDALAIYQGHQDHSAYLDDPECNVDIEDQADMLEAVEIRREIEKLQKRSMTFPKREQDLLNALYFENNGLCSSISDAGKIMGISKQSAQELHSKAIAKLKKAA